MKPVRIKLSDHMEGGQITVHVQVVKDWRARLGLFLLAMACRVLRCNFQVVMPEKEDE